MSFYVDRTGDFTSLPPQPQDQTPSLDYIPLSNQTRSKMKKNERRKSGKGRGQGTKLFVKASKEDKELIEQDYLENCDEFDIDFLQSLKKDASRFTFLASANLKDDVEDTLHFEKMRMDDMKLGSDNGSLQDEKVELAEQGYFEALTRMHEDENDGWQTESDENRSDINNDDHEDDDEDDLDLSDDFDENGEIDFDKEQFDFKNEARAIMRESDQESSLVDISDSSSDGTPISKRKMKSLKEKMLYDQERDELDYQFESQLDKDMDTDSDDEDNSWQSASAKKKTSKRAKKAKRLEKAIQATERKKQAAHLESILKKSGKGVGRDMIAYLDSINEQICRWATDKGLGDTLFLPPMPQAVRKPVVLLCKMYSCKPKIQGSGKKKSLMLFRTAVTHSTPEWKSFVGLSLGSNPNKPVKLEGNTTMGPRKKTSGSKKETLSKKAANSDGLVVGSKVGAKAAVISSDNVGHKMMRLMGWQPGESLGVNGTGGIVDPIAAVIRGNRKGLGS